MHEKGEFVKVLLKHIGIALLVVLPLAGALFWLRLSIDESVDKVVERRTSEAQDAELLNYLASLKSQDRNFGDEYLQLMERKIPTSDQIIDLSNQIEDLAGQFSSDPSFEFGFSLQNESAPQAEGDLGSIGFSVSVRADNLSTVIEFAETLRRFKFLTVLDSFSMERRSGAVNASISARTFYRAAGGN